MVIETLTIVTLMAMESWSSMIVLTVLISELAACNHRPLCAANHSSIHKQCFMAPFAVFVLMMNACVMIWSIDDNYRDVVLIVWIDVFRHCSFWLRVVEFDFDSDFWINFNYFCNGSSDYAIMKFVCRLQLAECNIFLLVMSSLVLRFVLWFLEFLWRQFRQLKWYSCVWFQYCGDFFCYLRLFQHVKCTFDSSASVNMMTTMNVCITITTVMSTKFLSRSHHSCLDVYDNSIQNIGNVFCSIHCWWCCYYLCILSKRICDLKIDCDWYWRTVFCFFHIHCCRTEFALYSNLIDIYTQYFFWTEFLI